MKTMNYKMRKGFITLVIVALISFVSSSATEGHESPTTGKNAGTVKTVEMTVESSRETTTGTLQDWMTSGSYWENVESSNFDAENQAEVSNSNLLKDLENWMSKGTYWSESKEKEVKKDTSFHLQSWMKKGSYWSKEN